ncbi:hypothetical protein Q7A53_16905 [Halobacillus rhizosphaerae]|uniref:hypothetical protein n=1 Tax=Halobacillus rhizosphaerae TaxID=3064889 RepID=UPI00398AB5D4
MKNSESVTQVIDLIKETRLDLQKNLDDHWDSMAPVERESMQHKIMELVEQAVNLAQDSKTGSETKKQHKEDRVIREDGDDLTDYFENDHLDGTEFHKV